MIEKCDMSGLQDVVDVCIKELKENHFGLLKSIIMDAITSGLLQTYSVRSNLEMAIRDILINIKNYE